MQTGIDILWNAVTNKYNQKNMINNIIINSLMLCLLHNVYALYLSFNGNGLFFPFMTKMFIMYYLTR